MRGGFDFEAGGDAGGVATESGKSDCFGDVLRLIVQEGLLNGSGKMLPRCVSKRRFSGSRIERDLRGCVSPRRGLNASLGSFRLGLSLLLGAVGGWTISCATMPEGSEGGNERLQAVVDGGSDPQGSGPEGGTILRPIFPMVGYVVSVNPELRFAVVEFLPGRVPQPGTRFRVLRNGEEVGRAIITPPRRDELVAADVLEGGIQQGDELRPVEE